MNHNQKAGGVVAIYGEFRKLENFEKGLKLSKVWVYWALDRVLYPWQTGICLGIWVAGLLIIGFVSEGGLSKGLVDELWWGIGNMV